MAESMANRRFLTKRLLRDRTNLWILSNLCRHRPQRERRRRRRRGRLRFDLSDRRDHAKRIWSEHARAPATPLACVDRPPTRPPPPQMAAYHSETSSRDNGTAWNCSAGNPTPGSFSVWRNCHRLLRLFYFSPE